MEHFDVVIIGTGAGGGTLAHRLAPSGKRILLLERGDFVPREPENWSPTAVIDAGRYDAHETWSDQDGRPFEPGEASRLADEIRTRTAVREERQRTRLEEIRAGLSAEEQTLLTLRIDQQLSWEEIAVVFSESGAAVDTAALRKRFQRLKDRLAELLRDAPV